MVHVRQIIEVGIGGRGGGGLSSSWSECFCQAWLHVTAYVSICPISSMVLLYLSTLTCAFRKVVHTAVNHHIFNFIGFHKSDWHENLRQ